MKITNSLSSCFSSNCQDDQNQNNRTSLKFYSLKNTQKLFFFTNHVRLQNGYKIRVYERNFKFVYKNSIKIEQTDRQTVKRTKTEGLSSRCQLSVVMSPVNFNSAVQIKPRGIQHPRLYGLAKIHKSYCLLRPAVSMRGQAYHKVSKQFAV